MENVHDEGSADVETGFRLRGEGNFVGSSSSATLRTEGVLEVVGDRGEALKTHSSALSLWQTKGLDGVEDSATIAKQLANDVS